MEYEIDEFERKYERIMNQLGKTQEDFQDLLDLAERIAAGKEPSAQQACQVIVNRFNPGAYEDDVS